MTDLIPIQGRWVIHSAGLSRVHVDTKRGQWIRLPGPHEDGSISRSNGDLRWQRLAPMVVPDLEDEWTYGLHVAIGHPVRIHTGMREHWTTSPVRRIEKMTKAFRQRLDVAVLEAERIDRWRITDEDLIRLSRSVH